MLPQVQLDNWFTYHPPTAETEPKYAAIRAAEGDFIRAVVGREGGEVVGWAAAYSYGASRDVAVFVGVFVRPECRRRGLGSALINEAVKLCPVDKKVRAAPEGRRLLSPEARVEVAYTKVGTT